MMNTSNVDEAQSKHQKRRYEPPIIEETGSFERLVLTCGHHAGQGGACGEFDEFINS